MGGLIIYSNVLLDFNINKFHFIMNEKESHHSWYYMHFYEYAITEMDMEKFIFGGKQYESDIEERNWYYDNKK